MQGPRPSLYGLRAARQPHPSKPTAKTAPFPEAIVETPRDCPSELSKILAGLRGDKALIVVSRVGNDLHTVLKSTIQSVGESNGKAGG